MELCQAAQLCVFILGTWYLGLRVLRHVFGVRYVVSVLVMPLDRDPDFLFLNTHKVHLKSFKGGSSCWSGDHTSFDSCKSYTLKARFAENKIVSNYTYPMTIILLDSRPFRVKLFLQSRVYTRQEALCHECWSQCSS